MAGDEGSQWKAASIVFRIATVAMSLASAIMTATSTQCLYREDGSPDGTVSSYSDYGSLKHSALANLPAAVLQGVAIYLEVAGRQNAAKTVELIDKLVLALTLTSAPLLLAVDDITSCGPPRPRAGSSQGQRPRGRGRGFTEKLHSASFLSLGTLASAAGAGYTTRVAKTVAETPTRESSMPQLSPPRPRQPSGRELKTPPSPLSPPPPTPRSPKPPPPPPSPPPPWSPPRPISKTASTTAIATAAMVTTTTTIPESPSTATVMVTTTTATSTPIPATPSPATAIVTTANATSTPIPATPSTATATVTTATPIPATTSTAPAATSTAAMLNATAYTTSIPTSAATTTLMLATTAAT